MPEDEDLVLPDLKIGQVVRVYRTHSAAPLWLLEPQTGKCAEPAQVGHVREDHAVGKVRDRSGHRYQVTVLRGGR